MTTTSDILTTSRDALKGVPIAWDRWAKDVADALEYAEGAGGNVRDRLADQVDKIAKEWLKLREAVDPSSTEEDVKRARRKALANIRARQLAIEGLWDEVGNRFQAERARLWRLFERQAVEVVLSYVLGFLHSI